MAHVVCTWDGHFWCSLQGLKVCPTFTSQVTTRISWLNYCTMSLSLLYNSTYARKWLKNALIRSATTAFSVGCDIGPDLLEVLCLNVDNDKKYYVNWIIRPLPLGHLAVWYNLPPEEEYGVIIWHITTCVLACSGLKNFLSPNNCVLHGSSQGQKKHLDRPIPVHSHEYKFV